uniref:Uncharacterized protein n=1 Tax=Theileria annulata TaxID=5874 RepID=A0A3B0MMP6_THEAN
MKRIIIYIIILKYIKCVESLRRFGFVNLIPNQINSLTQINTKSLIRTKLLNKYNKLNYKNIFAKNSQYENCLSDDLFDCPGFNHIFNQSYVFSGEFEDLGVNNLLSRELDYRKYSLESHKGLKKFMAVVLSAVAVGALYKFATFLKDIIEQQVIDLVSSVTV